MTLRVSTRPTGRYSTKEISMDWLIHDFLRHDSGRETLAEMMEDIRLDEIGLDELLGEAVEDRATEADARLVDEMRKATGRRFLIDMTLCVMAIGMGAVAISMASLPEPHPEMFGDRMMQVEILLREIMDIKEEFIY